MQVVIMRGLPGSGKSSWVQHELFKRLSDRSLVCSADHYHVVDGVYQFNPAKVGEAHAECFRKFLGSVGPLADLDVVYVDNTNLAIWELAAYYRLAEVLCERVTIVQVNCPLSVCLTRQTHGVPHSRMWTMSQTLAEERLPPHWQLEMFNGV